MSCIPIPTEVSWFELSFLESAATHTTFQTTTTGNLLRTPDGRLAYLDFGMMADIDEKDRYGLFGLVIGLQNKDLPLVTENLLKVSMSSPSRMHVRPHQQTPNSDARDSSDF